MNKRLLKFVVILIVGVFVVRPSVAQTPGATQDQPPPPKSTAPFSPHDLNGLWMTASGFTGAQQLVDPNSHPPFTPWGQTRFDASFPSLGPRDVPGKENDPILRCDPDGVPKILGSPHPFEIFMLPDRMLQIFEKHHDWREIWTDGRELPKDFPQLTWNGYSVGKWKGDTFVIESVGFNDVPWLDYYGDPHSESMRLTEEYKRVDHDTLSINVTIDDPVAYKSIWVGKPHLFTLKPTWGLQEYYCINEDVMNYDKDIRLRSDAIGDKPAKTDATKNPQK